MACIAHRTGAKTLSKPRIHPVYAAMGTSIFEEISGLARETGAINLGQGFPDRDGPEDIRRAAADALMAGPNQYPPMLGIAELRDAVAAHYRAHHGLDITSANVVVTSGATEALAASILALVQPGDEVVILQPAYDAYAPLVRRAGGTPRFVTLHPPEWRIDRDAIAAAIGPRTRMLILNNPLNPAARCFTRGELETLAGLCIEHDLVALCDEVWEHVVFDDRDHIPLYAIPGMADRTVKIGSAGKIFALTGWKVGFVVAAPALHAAVARAHQFLSFTTPPNLQVAVAYGLGRAPAYFETMRRDLQRSRDRLVALLEVGGFVLLPSDGTYFVCVDLAASGIEEDDRAFCLRIVRTCGVAAIPLSAFYEEKHARGIIRLCFAKQDAVLDEAAARLIAARRAPIAANTVRDFTS